uniref:Uncharacterized protein n=1 Tax=Oryza punctata TaxID=4537 RepID=A0A0E0L1C7_ORYPU
MWLRHCDNTGGHRVAAGHGSDQWLRIEDDSLEKEFARIYTPVMFKKTGCDITRWFNIVCCLFEDSEVRDEVRLSFDGQSLETVHNHYWKMGYNILCSHIFAIMKFLGLDTIPLCRVMLRWTMEAKPCGKRNFDLDEIMGKRAPSQR